MLFDVSWSIDGSAEVHARAGDIGRKLSQNVKTSTITLVELSSDRVLCPEPMTWGE